MASRPGDGLGNIVRKKRTACATSRVARVTALIELKAGGPRNRAN